MQNDKGQIVFMSRTPAPSSHVSIVWLSSYQTPSDAHQIFENSWPAEWRPHASGAVRYSVETKVLLCVIAVLSIDDVCCGVMCSRHIYPMGLFCAVCDTGRYNLMSPHLDSGSYRSISRAFTIIIAYLCTLARHVESSAGLLPTGAVVAGCSVALRAWSLCV